MDYDFTRRERDFGRIVFALTLDQKKMTERIVIGKSDEVRRRLEHGNGEVYYDRTRPLGELLLHFESDTDREWSVNASRLHESYGKAFPFESKRWELAAPVSDFLHEKYKTDEPSAMFAAMRTWEEYLNCYNLSGGPQRFIDNMTMLYRPFSLYAEYRYGVWQEDAADALSQSLHDGESQVELWYPVAKRPFECVVAFASFLPLIFYYLHKIEEWGFVFAQCKVCGSFFLAPNKRYTICSDGCRKEQALDAKRRFDESAKGDRLEQLHESSYYYWYNRLRKLKRAKNTDAEKLTAVTAAFEQFRAEAVRQKSEVRRGERKLADFTSWLMQQQDEVDRLMDE